VEPEQTDEPEEERESCAPMAPTAGGLAQVTNTDVAFYSEQGQECPRWFSKTTQVSLLEHEWEVVPPWL